MSREIFGELAKNLGPAAIAVIVGVRGSAPRHLGTMMLFRPDGSLVGTVGGGKVELAVAEAASRCLASGTSLGLEVEMTGTEATGSQAICGGVVDLLIGYIADPAPYAAAVAALSAGTGIVLAIGLLPPGKSMPGELAQAVYDWNGTLIAGNENATDSASVAAAVASDSGFAMNEAVQRAYICTRPAEKLLILGGGHVGLAIARFATDLDFRVFVGDERPEFVLPSRFPATVMPICGPYRDIIENFDFGDSSYIVVATPSHQSDLACMEALMGRGWKYLGFVGSRRKTRMIFEKLVDEGFDRDEVYGLRAPIGIDIGAETPAEIAVSILAEIIAVRRNSAFVDSIDQDRTRRRT
ncbi:MAG: XdhC family protein [Spirochaetaceae bacterium]|nr:XdhC family protein [Spirochaetaceae bacterium]